MSAFFRVPNDNDVKSLWIKAIREANNDNYNGMGFVCSNHFSPEKNRGNAQRATLIKGIIPSVFEVECIESIESIESIECDTCNHKKSEIDKLNREITKITLNSEMKDKKMQEKIENLQCIVADKTQEICKLKKKLELIEKQKDRIKALENDLFALKTTPNINVSDVERH